MTAKDYRAIAAALREDRAFVGLGDYASMTPWERGAYDQWHTAVLAIGRVLAADNPRFDSERFYSAAGFVGGAK